MVVEQVPRELRRTKGNKDTALPQGELVSLPLPASVSRTLAARGRTRRTGQGDQVPRQRGSPFAHDYVCTSLIVGYESYESEMKRRLLDDRGG